MRNAACCLTDEKYLTTTPILFILIAPAVHKYGRVGASNAAANKNSVAINPKIAKSMILATLLLSVPYKPISRLNSLTSYKRQNSLVIDIIHGGAGCQEFTTDTQFPIFLFLESKLTPTLNTFLPLAAHGTAYSLLLICASAASALPSNLNSKQ